jgi:regulator of sigma D
MESKKDKFRSTLFRMADSGKFIPGIYNYCDRWCERCSLSHKCLTYAHEQEMRAECNDPETNILDSEKLWEQIRLSFEVTLDMISENAKDFGIHLDELDDGEVPEYVEGPVVEMASEYGCAMGKWLEENEEKLISKANQLLAIYDTKESATKFADAIEIVQWYCYYIRAKIHRSFFNLNSRMMSEGSDEDVLADNKGSAKAAILAINRSMEALAFLFLQLKDQEDEILNFLRQLSGIRKQLLTTFPTAMEFKRPGFDD